MSGSAMPVTPSTTNESQQVRRRRKTSRCCGLYTPMRPRNSDQRRRIIEVCDESASATAMTIQEARSVGRAFASYTKIHGMRSIYRAQGN